MRTTAYGMVLDGVTFRYGPHAEPVLRNLTLTIPSGDHLAIVGPSGIGKSTLAGLLCGLLRPESGTVTLGGAGAADLPAERLAQLRTLIPQEAYVFTGSVWDNLTYLCPGATVRQVENAMVALRMQQLVAQWGGLAAELVPAALSAGERQLVALVRAYLSPAPVAVLDEATCHLDPVAERQAEEAFADREGTLIVIAHRVSSALRARRILVLDGVNAAVGDHLTLMSTSPLYRELLGHWQGAPAVAADRAAAVDVPATPDRPVPGQAPLLVFGQVKRGDNSPLVGATVTLTDLSGRQLDRDCADPGGHYQLSPPVEGSYLVICASSAHQPTAALVAVADAPVRHDVLLAGAGTSLSGVVRQAESGAPLATAVVTLVNSHGDVAGTTSTDPQGEFRFVELDQGHYTLTVSAQSSQPVARGVTIPAQGHVNQNVEVTARAQLAGVVRSATTNLPVPEALATLLAADGCVAGSVITDANGRFVFDDLASGTYTLIATGYPLVATEVTLGGGVPTETVITLWPPAPDSSTPAPGNAGDLVKTSRPETDGRLDLESDRSPLVEHEKQPLVTRGARFRSCAFEGEMIRGVTTVTAVVPEPHLGGAAAGAPNVDTAERVVPRLGTQLRT